MKRQGDKAGDRGTGGQGEGSGAANDGPLTSDSRKDPRLRVRHYRTDESAASLRTLRVVRYAAA